MVDCGAIIEAITTLKNLAQGNQLNMTEMLILLTLFKESTDIPYKDLSDELDTTVTTIARTCKRLGSNLVEQRDGTWKDKGLGLVIAGPNPRNTREYSVKLSSTGIKLMERVCKRV